MKNDAKPSCCFSCLPSECLRGPQQCEHTVGHSCLWCEHHSQSLTCNCSSLSNPAHVSFTSQCCTLWAAAAQRNTGSALPSLSVHRNSPGGYKESPDSVGIDLESVCIHRQKRQKDKHSKQKTTNQSLVTSLKITRVLHKTLTFIDFSVKCFLSFLN